MSFLQSIIDKHKAKKQKAINKEKFKEELLKAVSDGKITKEEIEKLEKEKSEFGLVDDDIKNMKAEIFTAAFNAAKNDQQITKEEEQELLDIQKYLGIEEAEISNTKKELARLRILNEIQNGNMPTPPTVTNLVTQKAEVIYWAEPSSLVEEKVINRRFQGGSRGVSLRIMKGVSYRIGAYQGRVVSQTGMVVVSNGELIITSKRVIFRGDRKSFSIKLENILDIQLFSNGIYFSENNKSKLRMINFNQEGNHNIIGAVLSHAINHYGDK